MATISVIVPVYKVEQYLERCVNSILNQTYSDFELILVDDGSPDNCGKMCDEYAAANEKTHVIHRKNGGLSAARNSGIEWALKNSNSEYIAFIDSDDTVKAEYLEVLYDAAYKNNSDISVCKARRVFSDKELEEHMHLAVSQERQLTNFDGKGACVELYTSDAKISISAWAKLYRKNLFEHVRFPEGKIHEDQAVTPILLYTSNIITACEEQLYCYYIRQDSIMGKRFTAKRFDDIDALQKIEEFFISNEENNLAEIVNKKKTVLHALYTLKARRAHTYRTIPEKYKISRKKAWKSLDDKTKTMWKEESKDYYIHTPNRILIKILGVDGYQKLKNIFGRG